MEFKLANKRKDELITLSDYLSGWETYNLIKDKLYDPIWSDLIFMTMDENNNGYLTEEEIIKYMGYFEYNFPNVKKDTSFTIELYTNMEFILANKERDERITKTDFYSGAEK